ncbi:metalloregulator ArsR/SmtB family transcription factor [Sulfurirhabdus autotrophica]|uniref:ArsR family transcriptional regulator n=1 Tax=Sulfurirhabdus autotrophica TaxID=1706046 RepID=A0A4R3Y942_9PROT|nr:metalloregulator ArsR/SmtB family transcription factor [Sulfurirhabdus autotrophica]TCV87488.1 ArsR family transcriptional regulator [Sulfurirhabdus autotrophica]
MLDSNQFFDILADETRRRVLVLLLKSQERCVCDIFQVLGLSQPKVSRHLAVMREAGVLASRKEGTWVHYRIHPQLPLWAVRILESMVQGIGESSPYAIDNDLLNEQGTGNACCS